MDRSVLSFFLLATLLAGPVATLAMAPPAAPGRPMLVIAWQPDRVIAQAQGRPVGPVEAPFAVLARGDNGFRARLAQAGAWAVLDAEWVAALCGAKRV
ncbi:hypothetical protein [Roseivivax lentus]|nr:hypothetical protein [Roseivivax lentus]